MEDCLVHHGIKGMKWGVRRYRNKDGTLTPAGKKRYSKAPITVQSKTIVDNWNGKDFSTTTHIFKKGSGSKKQRSIIDAMAKSQDYDSARKFDRIGEQALVAYKKDGEEAAKKILSEQMRNNSYEYSISDEDWGSIVAGSRYVSYTLTVFGNSKVYGTYGDADYSDDQYFANRTK